MRSSNLSGSTESVTSLIQTPSEVCALWNLRLEPPSWTASMESTLQSQWRELSALLRLACLLTVLRRPPGRPCCLGIFVVFVQLLSHVQLFVTPWRAACQASLSFTISWSSLTELLMPSNHLILGDVKCPLFSILNAHFSVSEFYWFVNTPYKLAFFETSPCPGD